jgi:gluconate kinase
MNNVPSILYLYGPAGAGKNFVGDVAGRLTGRYVYHADVDLTPEMRAAVAEKRPFTPEMRDRYYNVVAGRLEALLEKHGALVATQGTYKRQHREWLRARLPGLETVCVTADDALILSRLWARGGDITPEYAALLRAAFEPPLPGEKVIINNAGEAEIISQMTELYESR